MPSATPSPTTTSGSPCSTSTGPSARRTARPGTCSAASPDDPNTLLIINEFATREGAEAFAADPSLPEAMARAGVTGEPRIEFYELVERVTY